MRPTRQTDGIAATTACLLPATHGQGDVGDTAKREWATSQRRSGETHARPCIARPENLNRNPNREWSRRSAERRGSVPRFVVPATYAPISVPREGVALVMINDQVSWFARHLDPIPMSQHVHSSSNPADGSSPSACRRQTAALRHACPYRVRHNRRASKCTRAPRPRSRVSLSWKRSPQPAQRFGSCLAP